MTDSDQPGDGETTSTKTRHPYTNDYLAAVIVVASLVLIGFAMATDRTVPPLLWAETILATAWAFGPKAVDALRSVPLQLQGSGGRRARRPPASDRRVEETSESSNDGQSRDDQGRFQ